MAKSKLDPATAFDAYVAMGDKRSINGLCKILEARGYAVARSSLMRWQKQFGWDKGVSSRMEQDAKAIRIQAEMAAGKAAVQIEPFTPAETYESTLRSLEQLTSAIAQVVVRQTARYIAAEQIAMDPPEILQWARAAGDLGKAVAEMQKVLMPAPGKAQPVLRDKDGAIIEGGGTGAPGHAFPAGIEEMMAALAKPPTSR